MDEETTTDAPVDTGENQVIQGIQVDNQGQALSEPEETEQAEAVETTNEPEVQTIEETSEPSDEDEQLTKFAQVKGLELTSDNEKKLAKMAMNAEKLMHNKSNKASELERTMGQMSDESVDQVARATGQDPEVLKRLQRMEVKDSIREFWDTNPDAKQYETEMATIAVESGLYGSPEAILKASYAIARSSNTDALKSQGKQEALKSLAQKQQAAVPRGNAVNTNVSSGQNITPQNVDQLVGMNDMNWYMANRDAINKAMAG